MTRLVAEETGGEKSSEAVLAWIDRGGHEATAERYWTLDPIDGTKGFLRREQYAVALALIEAGEVVVGLLACPNLADGAGGAGALLAAERGAGTRSFALWDPSDVRGAPVRVKELGSAASARFCESVESGHSDQEESAKIAAALGISAPPLRMDSQCKYAAVARGDASIYLRLPTRADYREKILGPRGGQADRRGGRGPRHGHHRRAARLPARRDARRQPGDRRQRGRHPRARARGGPASARGVTSGDGPAASAPPVAPRRRRVAESITFSEREFYQREFRDRTLAIALAEPVEPSALAPALAELAACNANAVVIAPSRALLEGLGVGPILRASLPRLEGAVWRAVREQPCAGIAVARRLDFASVVRELAQRLGVFKLVWLDARGGFRNRSGARLSFVHRAELRQLLANPSRSLPDEPRVALLRAVGAMLEAGVPAVNVCTAAGLADELFTYAGSGTLFTRKRYMKVRPLGVDDFDAADDLIRRGVAEGYLLGRNESAVDAVLANGFGAFVEDRYLAGIGALLPGGDARAAELASLYALTRFLGEGVGASLVQYGVAEARRLGLAYVFACTTSEGVGAFFKRQGFREVPHDQVPDRRWLGYDPERRMHVRCFRMDLTSAPAP